MLRENLAGAGVVINDERAQSHKPHARQPGERRRSLLDGFQRHFKPERRAFAHDAIDTDLPPPMSSG